MTHVGRLLSGVGIVSFAYMKCHTGHNPFCPPCVRGPRTVLETRKEPHTSGPGVPRAPAAQTGGSGLLFKIAGKSTEAGSPLPARGREAVPQAHRPSSPGATGPAG